MIHHLRGPAGRIEALIDDPGALCTTGSAPIDPHAPPIALRAAVVLAHPHPLYGGTMNSKVVFQAAKAFCRLGCAVLRFNSRGAGTSEGSFDEGRGEAEDFRTAVDFMADRYPGVELWAAGVSFGSWVAMIAGAHDQRVALLLGIAVPAATYDFSAVRQSSKPKFFIQGERDELCPVKDLRVLYSESREPKEMVVIDMADHLFDGHVSDVADAIVELLGDL